MNLNPITALDELVTIATRRRLEREKQLVVVGPEAQRGPLIRGIARFLIGLIAMFAAQFGGPVVQLMAWPVIGFIIGSAALTTLRAPFAYRSGWLDGRGHMADSIKRTGGLMQAYEYDAVQVLGIASPVVPDTPEGLE